MVVAQDPAAAGEGVLVEGAGLLVLAQRVQVDGEVVGRGEGVGVVVAQDPAAAGEGVLVEGAGLLVLAQRVQVGGEVVGRAEGVGVVVAQDPAAAGEGVLVEGAGLLVVAQRAQVAARLLAEVRVSGWSSPRTRRRRVRVSSSRVRACWYSPSAPGRGRGCWPR